MFSGTSGTQTSDLQTQFMSMSDQLDQEGCRNINLLSSPHRSSSFTIIAPLAVASCTGPEPRKTHDGTQGEAVSERERSSRRRPFRITDSAHRTPGARCSRRRVRLQGLSDLPVPQRTSDVSWYGWPRRCSRLDVRDGINGDVSGRAVGDQ